MQVRATDPAGLDRHQYLTRAGDGFGDIVADDHRAIAENGSAHQLVASAAESPAASVIALTMACPARPSN